MSSTCSAPAPRLHVYLVSQLVGVEEKRLELMVLPRISHCSSKLPTIPTISRRPTPPTRRQHMLGWRPRDHLCLPDIPTLPPARRSLWSFLRFCSLSLFVFVCGQECWLPRRASISHGREGPFRGVLRSAGRSNGERAAQGADAPKSAGGENTQKRRGHDCCAKSHARDGSAIFIHGSD